MKLTEILVSQQIFETFDQNELGYNVKHRGEYNPFSDSSLDQMGKTLEEGWTEQDQQMVHTNPSIQDLKNLARHDTYHSARFVIYKDGTVVAADSELYTHHSMAPAMGAWLMRGYVKWMGGKEYLYRSMEVYSPKSVDHPVLRKWEQGGIGNGNPEVVEEKWSQKYKKSIDCYNPKGFSQRAHCAGRRKRRAGGQTKINTVGEKRLDSLVESMLQYLKTQGLTEADAMSHINDRLDEDLRKWFKEKWVRFGPDGKIRGACARGSEGEGKPKCLPQKKAWALGEKKRATAARRKRREDSNPERKGAARNVATKEGQETLDQTHDHLPSVDDAKRLLPKILTRVQEAYDAWDEQDTDTYAGGGICHIIADKICDVLSTAGIDSSPVSCSHAQHVEVAAKFSEGVYTIDIPYHIYETGGGFSWNKKPDVKFEANHVTWYPVSGDPDDFDRYIEAYESVLAEKKDACYHKVKQRYKIWPSAYASGALVQCRKKRARGG
jgi:hypothetical protein